MKRRSFLKLLIVAQAAIVCRVSKSLQVKALVGEAPAPVELYEDGVYIWDNIQRADADYREALVDIWKDGVQLAKFRQQFVFTVAQDKRDERITDAIMCHTHIEMFGEGTTKVLAIKDLELPPVYVDTYIPL